MFMIHESIIEKVVGQFESQQVSYEKAVQEFARQQPALLSFVMSETEGAYTEDELDFLLYLAIVIYKSIEKGVGEELDRVSEEEIIQAEEANWEIMSKSGGKAFRERLNPFFENSSQEDLLAFVEDSLTSGAENEDGEDVRLTPEGREPMFVTLKTMIDVLTTVM
jgi:hypothetical protein